MAEADYQNLHGAIKVIYYMIGIVSRNRQSDLKEELIKLFNKNKNCERVQKTIAKATGIKNICEIFA